ncbi:MAG: DNRLRE domain-containing protein, partial [Chloroflexota bacterium]|nr:DNRLRE domain-containing protein [Chloroflexota bacterium]
DVTHATLRLYATSATDDGPAVYMVSTDWAEDALTWNVRPPRTSDAIDDADEIEAERWVEYDVTGFVTADGAYTFVLIADGGDGVDFSAREGTRPPELALTLGRSPPVAAPRGEGETVTVVAAGDIACDPDSGSFRDGDGTADNCRQAHTAALVEAINPDLVLGLGDMQYEAGTLAAYEASYDLSWGRFKDKTLVVAGGSHDFYGGGDFYAYWGEQAGPAPLRNWFSRDVGAWHLVFLNSYCDEVGGCKPGSDQYEWLRSDLAESDARCTLALWHEPRYASGSRHGDDEAVDPLWDLLYERGAELVLVGHEHNYERFAPLDAQGDVDPGRGLRQFIVGTGGKSLGGDWETTAPGSEVRQEETYGVLKLTLRPGGYDWAFVPEAGKNFQDAGSAVCHDAPESGADQSSDITSDADSAARRTTQQSLSIERMGSVAHPGHGAASTRLRTHACASCDLSASGLRNNRGATHAAAGGEMRGNNQWAR